MLTVTDTASVELKKVFDAGNAKGHLVIYFQGAG